MTFGTVNRFRLYKLGRAQIGPTGLQGISGPTGTQGIMGASGSAGTTSGLVYVGNFSFDQPGTANIWTATRITFTGVGSNETTSHILYWQSNHPNLRQELFWPSTHVMALPVVVVGQSPTADDTTYFHLWNGIGYTVRFYVARTAANELVYSLFFPLTTQVTIPSVVVYR